jgi:hypothetical protein
MPIIFLRNPRSGSHFRHIGEKGGRPLQHSKKKAGTVWASCNGPSGPKGAKWHGFDRGEQISSIEKAVGAAFRDVVGSIVIPSGSSGAGRVAFTKPCRPGRVVRR